MEDIHIYGTYFHCALGISPRGGEATETCTNCDCEDKGCEGVGSSILNADTIHFFSPSSAFSAEPVS